jgi:hypothetical protein
MDDLPRSFIAFPMSEYSARLPGYDLFPEWVSNWGYGNIQKNRNRMFMLGAQKAQGWSFRPGETENLLTMEDVLGDLGGPGAGNYLPNHDRHTLTAKCGRAKHLVTLGRDREATYGDLKKFFDSVPNGTTLKYVASDGKTIKHKPSHSAAYWGAHAHVLDGGSVQVHPVRHTPYTIRERARIQGFPDDFIFYGTKFDGRGEWDHEKNNHLVKQTGKAMPVQFCRYVSSLVHDHLVGQPVESSGRRVIPPNNYVSAAKTWYCENIGYADQARACGDCWLARGCSIRWAKYRVGPKPVGAPRPAPAARESTPRRRGAARGTRFAELPPGREKEIKL